MISFEELDLFTLKGKKKTAYKRLLENKYKGSLSGEDPLRVQHSEIICIGALKDNEPVAIAVGAYRPKPLPGELYCIGMKPSEESLEIKRILLEKMEATLRAKGSAIIHTIYPIEKPDTQDFENLLQERHWSKGVLALVRCHFNAKTFTTPWLHRDHTLPKGCELFLWKDLKKEERKQLEFLLEQKGIPGPVSPFLKENQIDWNSSVGLRSKNGVIGWMINWIPKKDYVEFRSFFIFPEFYLLGHSVDLLAESIRLVQKKPPRHAIMDVMMNFSDSRWVKFVKRRLLPYAESVERFADSWKTLS